MLERSGTVAIDTSSPSISLRQLIISASETDGFSVFKISMSSKSSPGNLLHFVPPLARGLIESSSQNFRQIFVIVFTESFNSSRKMTKRSWNVYSHSITTFLEDSIYY